MCMYTFLPEELYPLLAVASWCSVGAGGLLASNGFCVTELVDVNAPKRLLGEGSVFLGGGRVQVNEEGVLSQELVFYSVGLCEDMEGVCVV